ncbi:MAG: hypothetical protein EXR88_05730 [Gammaproteobacteria bacterium]|nr:hypothetical protein [Gammaproteobacteria bacterium]
MNTRFKACGLITLTTDFGTRDPFVGVMKGMILRHHPLAKIIDLTHEILPHWPAEAGFWLARTSEFFPMGSVHVAVVDPGVGTTREIALLETSEHMYLAPDNGLLGAVAARNLDARLWRVSNTALQTLGLAKPSATFHGRDIFAPLAAELASGRFVAEELGVPLQSLIPCWIEAPQITYDRVSGIVITIDHFGNLITNIEAASIEFWKDPLIFVGSAQLSLRRTYRDADPGECLALINSFGVVEIAVSEGRASEVLGLSRGAPVIIRDAVRRF